MSLDLIIAEARQKQFTDKEVASLRYTYHKAGFDYDREHNKGKPYATANPAREAYQDQQASTALKRIIDSWHKQADGHT